MIHERDQKESYEKKYIRSSFLPKFLSCFLIQRSQQFDGASCAYPQFSLHILQSCHRSANITKSPIKFLIQPPSPPFLSLPLTLHLHLYLQNQHHSTKNPTRSIAQHGLWFLPSPARRSRPQKRKPTTVLRHRAPKSSRERSPASCKRAS